MESLAHGGVSQGGRGLGGELVALSGQHCQRGAAEAGVILKEEEGQLAGFFGRAFWERYGAGTLCLLARYKMSALA